MMRHMDNLALQAEIDLDWNINTEEELTRFLAYCDEAQRNMALTIDGGRHRIAWQLFGF